MSVVSLLATRHDVVGHAVAGQPRHDRRRAAAVESMFGPIDVPGSGRRTGPASTTTRRRGADRLVRARPIRSRDLPSTAPEPARWSTRTSSSRPQPAIAGRAARRAATVDPELDRRCRSTSSEPACRAVATPRPPTRRCSRRSLARRSPTIDATPPTTRRCDESPTRSPTMPSRPDRRDRARRGSSTRRLDDPTSPSTISTELRATDADVAQADLADAAGAFTGAAAACPAVRRADGRRRRSPSTGEFDRPPAPPVTADGLDPPAGHAGRRPARRRRSSCPAPASRPALPTRTPGRGPDGGPDRMAPPNGTGRR